MVVIGGRDSLKGETMKTRTLVHATVVGLLAVGLGFGLYLALAGEKGRRANNSQVRFGPYRLSGPYQHENLTLFLIHGKDQLKGKTFLTLQEGLDRKKVIVHETNRVNELAIENVSRDAEIFVQSGDIVKGGQQDRTIAFDLVVPKRSGKLPVASFCVEAGRWNIREGEDARKFGSSDKHLPSKEGKIAVKGTTSAYQRRNIQGGVWKEVARKQMMLGKALGKSVKAGKSESSLQLTLEDQKLLEAVETYTKKLTPLIEGKKDVIGYAFAVNGQVNSADIYASHQLFKKLWPKLLNATVVEAIAEMQKGKKFKHARVEAIKTFMEDAEKGKASTKKVTRRIRLVTHETKNNVLFVTRDQAHKGVALRKNYITKSNLTLLNLREGEPSRGKK
jgi:hypothetical protein